LAGRDSPAEGGKRVLAGDAVHAQPVVSLECTDGGLRAAPILPVGRAAEISQVLQLLLQLGNRVAAVPRAHGDARDGGQGFDVRLHAPGVFRRPFEQQFLRGLVRGARHAQAVRLLKAAHSQFRAAAELAVDRLRIKTKLPQGFLQGFDLDAFGAGNQVQETARLRGGVPGGRLRRFAPGCDKGGDDVAALPLIVDDGVIPVRAGDQHGVALSDDGQDVRGGGGPFPQPDRVRRVSGIGKGNGAGSRQLQENRRRRQQAAQAPDSCHVHAGLRQMPIIKAILMQAPEIVKKLLQFDVLFFAKGVPQMSSASRVTRRK